VAPKEEIKLSAVLRFPLIFWVLTCSCVTVYIAVLTYNNNCADFVTQKWLSPERPIWQVCDDDKAGMYLKANSIMSITYLVAGFLTPLFGTIVDNIGLRAVLNVFAAASIAGVHATLGFSNLYPAFPLVALGICYSVYAAALWPSIALVIEPTYQATAYGVVTAVQNLGLAVGPLIVGRLMPAPRCATAEECISGWNRTEIFFVALGCAGVLCGLLLNLVDCTRKYAVLNLSDAAVKRKMAKDGLLPDSVTASAAESGDLNGNTKAPLLFTRTANEDN
jgi:MFS family permease